MTDIISTPKNPSRKPYIYKVTNFETDQYYIGSQCSGKIVGVNYFTSSTNKKFKEDFNTYREEKYEITIIKEFDDPKECVRAENYIIRNYIQKRDDLCLNRFYCCGKEKIFSTVGIHHSEETRKKISEVHKIKISIEGTIFNSLTEASKYYNVDSSTIRRWFKNKKHHTVYIEK